MTYKLIGDFFPEKEIKQFNGKNSFNSVPLSAFKEGIELAKKLQPESDKWQARITPILNQIQANRMLGKDTEITINDKTVLIFRADGSVEKHPIDSNDVR